MPVIESPQSWAPGILPTGDRDWDTCMRDLVGEVAKVVPHVVGARSEEVIDAAIDAWPERTGRSKDALSLRYQAASSSFSSVLNCEIDYALDIHQGETVQELIDGPAALAVEAIVEDLDRLIGKVR